MPPPLDAAMPFDAAMLPPLLLTMLLLRHAATPLRYAMLRRLIDYGAFVLCQAR